MERYWAGRMVRIVMVMIIRTIIMMVTKMVIKMVSYCCCGDYCWGWCSIMIRFSYGLIMYDCV